MTRDRQPGEPVPPAAPDHEAGGEPDLGAFLAAARATAPEPPPGLRARVLQDAHEVQAGRAAVSARQAGPVRAVAGMTPVRMAWLSDLWATLGGWAGGSGLAAATVAGLAVGFGVPGALPALSGVGSAATLAAPVATETTDDAFVTWLWPGVGTVIDDLSAGLAPAEEG